MTVEKSTRVTNSITKPRVVNNRFGEGRLNSAADTAEVADGADGDSCIFDIKIPVDARIRHVYLATDDLVGNALASVGFYVQDSQPDGTTFTEVDADCLANDVDVNDAAYASTDVRYTVKGIETVNQAAWQLAGLSARPSYSHFHVAVTFETDTEAAGTVTVNVEYVE